MTAAMFMDRALDGDPPPPGLAAPDRQALILHRLALAATLDGPAALRCWAGDLRGVLQQRWGDHDLVLAPAFA